MTKTIETKDVERLMNDQPDTVFINVLARENFEREHIPGSVNVPQDSEDFVKRVEEVAEGRHDRRIVVYCASQECDASPKAAKTLDAADFTNVLDYEGGMKAWREAGNEVRTGH